jgi:hypothetical protein
MLFNISDVPPYAGGGFRKGVQVSFTMPGADLPLLDETKYAIATEDTFFTLTKVEDTKLNQPTGHSWDVIISSLAFPYDDDYIRTLVGVSFGYNTLSTTQITQVVSATPADLTGNLSGMVGTLTGIDAVKIIVMLAAIPYGLWTTGTLDEFFDMIG